MSVISQANESHVPQIVELWKELMAFHAERDPQFARAEDGAVHFEKYLRDLLAKAEWRVFVALDGERVVGYLMAQVAKRPPVIKHRDFGFISDLAVTKAHRRRGVGQKLLRAAIAWFAERGLRRVEAHVATANEVSTAFWSAQGFEAYLHTMRLRLAEDD
jgi:ribosomal protein S18 acetylase RimI-like enzyme